MSINIYNGIVENDVELRPWSPVGIMATARSALERNLEWARARKSYLDTYITPDSSISSASTFYFPPFPSHMFGLCRVSRVSPINYIHCISSGTTYAIALNTTSGASLPTNTNKYSKLYASVKPSTSWDTTNPVRVVLMPSQIAPDSDDYVTNYFQAPGRCIPSPQTLDEMFLNFSRMNNGGVSAAEYNQLRACAIQAADFPVLHSALGSFSGYYTFSSWMGINFPLVADPNGPPLQKLLTLIFYLGSDGPTKLRVVIGGAQGGTIETASKTWYSQQLAEYQVDLTHALNNIAPMFEAHGRKFYEITISFFEGFKSAATIYSWAAYTGIPEGAFSA